MGCFSCKDSRVKCDLEKPSCGRYTPPLTASAIHASPVSVSRDIDQNVQIYAVHRMYYDLCFDASVGVFVALPFIAVNTSVSPFMHALQAAALAHSSANLNQYGLLPKLEYCAAVSALKRDIAEPAQLQNDAILMSIFLLGLFEACSCTDPSSLKTDFQIWLHLSTKSFRQLQTLGMPHPLSPNVRVLLPTPGTSMDY
uniref:Zn(2)-C6 fungal-type domain-containing protein n=1 Tax=Fusarium oxysporum (strain Fo5176) TaxID=660025 RepID=A0A0D2YFN5_FUSOF